MALGTAPVRRTTITARELERLIHADEDRTFAGDARRAFRRIVLLLEGGMALEAHQVAAAGIVLAERRARQLEARG